MAMPKPTPWQASVRFMRIAAPLGFALGVLNGAAALRQGLAADVAIDAFCAGVNLTLAWVNWRVYEL